VEFQKKRKNARRDGMLRLSRIVMRSVTPAAVNITNTSYLPQAHHAGKSMIVRTDIQRIEPCG